MPNSDSHQRHAARTLSKNLYWALPAFLLLHGLLSWQFLPAGPSFPVLSVEMASTISSHAQVYYDTGAGFNEGQSDTVPVQASDKPQTLHFRLPIATIKALRFDPLTAPGTVLIHQALVLRSDGSTAVSFPPSRIQGVSGFDQEEILPSGVRYRVRSDSHDPQFKFILETPLVLQSRYLDNVAFGAIALANGVLLIVELLIFLLLSRSARVVALVRNIPLQAAWILIPHALFSWGYLESGAPPPTLVVHMSSSVFSRAQVYYDIGQGISETESSSVPVRSSATPQELRLPLPFGRIQYLRFDPLTCPGTFLITGMQVLRSDGTVALSVPPANLETVVGFDRRDILPTGVQFRVRSDSYDPALLVPLNSALEFEAHGRPLASLFRLASVNFALLGIEALMLLIPASRNKIKSLVRSADQWARNTAKHLSNSGFLVFDRLAVWFYVACIALYIVLAAADFNGSSMGVFWRNYKVGAPATILAGTPQQIRADEFNYMTPGMLNQTFREQKFNVTDSVFGNHSTALLSVLPIRHVTTWVRPQYWPFFVLPADFAFAAWWQAKWFILVTGVFTLLLLITQSSFLSITGTLWLFFSQFTQWCYTWPSMLPEMCGLFCFTIVCACYLLVGTRKLALAIAAVCCAACAVNFALMAYLPHMLPYAWIGLFFMVAWCIAFRGTIMRPEARLARVTSVLTCLFIVAALMLIVVHDAHEAIQGIAATIYPGHRSVSGGGFSLAVFGTHFFSAFESETRFPPGYSNICEASGFFWLAPLTLFFWRQIRGLTKQRRVLLAGLWAAALLLAGWALLPIPAYWGSFLFLDRILAPRLLPALGFLNIAIVMTVLSSPGPLKRPGLDVKAAIVLPAVSIILILTNQSVGGYFSTWEVVLSSLWTSILAVLLWDGRKRLFAAAILIPSIFFFGLINPVQRGIDPITSSTLFQIVHSDKRLLNGKWMIFPDIFPASIFIAVGCDVFNGSKYLPDIDHFPLYAAHGLDTRILNNLGYVDVLELAPGEPPTVKRSPFGVTLAISPLDSLVKDLGIRYMAFHKRPSAEIRAHLKPIGSGNFSEFWLYEVQ